MKILQLRFKNLNSLYGEWHIDFTSVEYRVNGIFAIIGPTGAGKSTILDAICLALYGSTPRLGKITKSANEIMSRQTGECFAEVSFESAQGTYTCHWSQHRARKKADGKLAESKHEISDAINKQILESKKRDVANAIEEKTGMDFERFTRSILLAQGGFDTFLKADSDQRAPILEQITGTKIYTEISIQVHQRQKSEREKLQLLEAETSGIVLLSQDQEIQIKQQLAEKNKLNLQLEDKNRQIEEAILYLNTIADLKKDILLTEQKVRDIKQSIEAFKPFQEKLTAAQKAADLDGDFVKLKLLREQQQAEVDKLAENKAKQPEIETLLQVAEKKLNNADIAIEQSKTEKKSMSVIIQKVRELDLQLLEKANTRNDAQAKNKLLEQQLKQKQSEHSRLTIQLESLVKEKQNIDEYMDHHASDEILITQMAAIEEQLSHLQSEFSHLELKNKAIIREQKLQYKNQVLYEIKLKTLKKYQQKQQSVKQQCTLLQQALEQLLDGRELSEYYQDKDNLQEKRVLLSKIVDLESARKDLIDAHPCPLCGSTDHPYAKGNVPEIADTEKQIKTVSKLIRNVEKQQKELSNLQLLEKQSVEKVSLAKHQIELAKININNTDKTINDFIKEQKIVAQKLSQLKIVTEVKLKPLAEPIISDLNFDTDVNKIKKILKQRLKKWMEQKNKNEGFEKQVNDLKNNMNILQATIDNQLELLSGNQQLFEQLSNQHDSLSKQRYQLFGIQKTDEKELLLDQLIIKAEEHEKLVRKQRDETKQHVNTLTTQEDSLKKTTSQRGLELKQLEPAFFERLKSSGFSNEQLFTLALMTVAERNDLNLRAKQLENRKIELFSQQKDRNIRLAQELKKKITKQSIESLLLIQKDNKENIKLLAEQLGALKQKLQADYIAKDKMKEKQNLIEAQQTIYHRFEKLHLLIGSADGKKYRNYTQGLTFELMISHANRQLEKMSDRYLLIRDKDHPLELNVVDNYQAGEIRSTKNLSGGESFIVSLSLALGLSKMASRKVRVDSLFLDEGFGSLDEDALESALETLSGLQQNGKLIGVISHVAALKDRISTQINIIPNSAGKSIISAPGVDKF